MDHNAIVEAEVVSLYDELADDLARYAASLSGEPDLARDVVQEAFLSYFVERIYGRALEIPRDWLYERTRQYLEDRMSQSAGEEVGEENLQSVADPAASPELMAASSEMAQTILARLSPREHECLRLRAGGLAYNEIAEAMGLRAGTVGALLARAHHKIRSTVSGSDLENSGVASALQRLFQSGERHREAG